ncbi:MAG: Hsp33 family molecular chaperone HslO [Thomasclavelia sp.]
MKGLYKSVRDMGLKEPFTGSVPLQTGEIGDDFSYYFAVSEQTPSVVSVGVLVNDTNEVLASGGLYNPITCQKLLRKILLILKM